MTGLIELSLIQAPGRLHFEGSSRPDMSLGMVVGLEVAGETRLHMSGAMDLSRQGFIGDGGENVKTPIDLPVDRARRLLGLFQRLYGTGGSPGEAEELLVDSDSAVDNLMGWRELERGPDISGNLNCVVADEDPEGLRSGVPYGIVLRREDLFRLSYSRKQSTIAMPDRQSGLGVLGRNGLLAVYPVRSMMEHFGAQHVFQRMDPAKAARYPGGAVPAEADLMSELTGPDASIAARVAAALVSKTPA